MNRYEFVIKVLDQAVGTQQFGGHGPFWRGKSRDAFVTLTVFGQPLLVVGDSVNSNLVRAMQGETPFGSDMSPRPSGAIFRRMPAGRLPVSDDRIDFIARWVDDGCPEDEIARGAIYAPDIGGPLPDYVHNTYWREFDDWAMFQATPEVAKAIQDFFAVAVLWFKDAQHTDPVPEWHARIREPTVQSAVGLLSGLQIRTLSENYGNPIPLNTTVESYERFGSDRLPDDPLRPQDPRHNMNGPEMWFFWAAFCHAAIELAVSPNFWTRHLRPLMIGLMNDGVFRGRFAVPGFSSGGGHQPIRDYVDQIADIDLVAETRRRLYDAGFGR
jgi:hypothetical protein